MFSPNIEQAVNYSSLPPSLMPSRGSSEGRRDTAKHCCGKLMWRLINCFRSQEQGQIRPRPVIVDAHIAQYQAPVVTPSPRAGSVSSCDEDQDFERGTLLPKRHTPEPGRTGASTSAAATATAAASDADAMTQELPRHRRTDSNGSRGKGQVEAVRARVLPAGALAAAAAGKGGKFGAISQQEFAAMAELLGTDADEDDFCPTCLEAYTDDNPKIFTRCGHAFHMQCIYAWLERKSTCPLCERPMDLQDDIML